MVACSAYCKWRRWMGIEPTARALTRATGFEDQEAHQDSFISLENEPHAGGLSECKTLPY